MTAKRQHKANSEPAGESWSVAEQIHACFGQLAPAERKAARLLLTNYPVAGLDSLPELARRSAVSHPTILRLISKLGYSGFPAFQTALREELGARLMSPLGKPRDRSPNSSGASNFLAHFAETACDNIRQSAAMLPVSEFEGTVSLLLESARSVYLLGGRFTDSIATYLYMHLRVLRPSVAHITGPPVSWSEYLLDIDEGAVLVVFDIRRYQDDVVAFANEAAGRGARVVLFTDQWLSPIAGVATHVLPVRIEVPSSWDSSSAMLVLVEALIARVNNHEWDDLAERIAELEQLRARLGGVADPSP